MISDITTKFRKNIQNLTEFEKAVIVDKGTERAFTGELLDIKEDGVFACKLCGMELFQVKDKFDSGSGWPSFDNEIDGAVRRVSDVDGMRVEIVCASCGGHLGHVFEGEGMTAKSTRHCVNSVSLVFKGSDARKKDKTSTKRAYLAGGCFWGVEHYLQLLSGVESVISGFMGGHVMNPDYYDVVKGSTGHLETVEVIYNASKISYEEIVKHFFEIHDPEQSNGQGPDIGSQYLSAVFVSNEEEANIAAELIKKLEAHGYKIATQVLAKKEFFAADDGHQDYYERKGSLPYCHDFIPRFDRRK
ncbi:MAG: bifunctional methionine sulfoxide reductase B/A protein [Sulfurovum sp.]|nr:bifunctional methionine sulfoxide reductase B/A protein [Sulfurovum sp.]